MARRVFNRHEAVSAAIPTDGGYHAAIAVKALEGGGAPQFHPVLDGQVFKTALTTDEAASQALQQLANVDDEGQLHWS